MAATILPLTEEVLDVNNRSPSVRHSAVTIKSNQVSPVIERSTQFAAQIEEDSPVIRQRTNVSVLSKKKDKKSVKTSLPAHRRLNSLNEDDKEDKIAKLMTVQESIMLDTIKKNIGMIAFLALSFGLIAACVAMSVVAMIFSLNQSVPTGSVFVYSGIASSLISQSNEWLYCDGSEVSRDKYRNLFNVIGTSYGAGNGADTFNLPDLRNRYIRGSNVSTFSQLQTGGTGSVTLNIANLPAHDHNVGTLATASTGAHSHTVSDPSHNHGGSTGGGIHRIGGFGAYTILFGSSNEAATHTHSIATDYTGISLGSDGAHTHTIVGSTGSIGSGQPIELLPPYITLHFVIRI